MGPDFTDLKDMPLFVRRDEQRPLIGIALLPVHDMAPEIVFRRSCVVEQLRVLCAVRL